MTDNRSVRRRSSSCSGADAFEPAPSSSRRVPRSVRAYSGVRPPRATWMSPRASSSDAKRCAWAASTSRPAATRRRLSSLTVPRSPSTTSATNVIGDTKVASSGMAMSIVLARCSAAHWHDFTSRLFTGRLVSGRLIEPTPPGLRHEPRCQRAGRGRRRRRRQGRPRSGRCRGGATDTAHSSSRRPGCRAGSR